MRKKLLAIIATAAMVVAMIPSMVFADPLPPDTTLPKAVDGVITLTNDVELSSAFKVSGTVTIDLNGYDITPKSGFTDDALIVVKRGGNLIVQDNSAEKNGSINCNSNNKVYAAIKLTEKGESEIGTTAKLTINSGSIKGFYYGIAGNGGRHGTEITVNGGIINGVCSGDNLGIFHPQDGTLTVNGGIISGTTGIEMRAGTLVVNGGEITGSGALAVAPNGSGSTTKGAAIAVAQHATDKPINVTINDGTFSADPTGAALYVSNPQGNTDVKKTVKVDVKGGTFDGKVSDNSDKTDNGKQGGTLTIDKGIFHGDIVSAEEITADWVEITADGTTMDYIGTDVVAEAMKNLKSGDTLNISNKADKNITVPEGVLVENNTGSDLTVNGEKLENGNETIAKTPAGEQTPVTPDSTKPATGKTDATAATGDDMNMALPITVAGLALAAMAAVIATRRRHS